MTGHRRKWHRRLRHARHDRLAAFFVTTQFHAARAQSCHGTRQKLLRGIRMHEQASRAHCTPPGAWSCRRSAGAARDRDRPAASTYRWHTLLVVLDHRHARMLGDEADQAFAAARNRQVDDMSLSCSSCIIVSRLRSSTSVIAASRQVVSAQRRAQRRGDRTIALERLRTAAQQYGIAGVETQRGRVGRQRSAALRRSSRSARAGCARARCARRSPASRRASPVRPGRPAAQRSRTPAATAARRAGIQAQAVDQRGALCPSRAQPHIARVGGKDRRCIVFERVAIAARTARLPMWTSVATIKPASRQAIARVADRTCAAMLAVRRSSDAHAWDSSATRSSRRTIVSP